MGRSAALVAAARLTAELDVLGAPALGDLTLPPTPSVLDWARSGAMALTGRVDGPPRLSPGAPASALRAALAVLTADAAGAPIPGVELLGERAAYAGLHRNAPWSPGGGFRALPARDGWLGLSLARDPDLELLPALMQAGLVADPWTAVADWLASQRVADAAARAQLLGLPAAAIVEGTRPPQRAAVQVTLGGARRPVRAPVVVDLTSLWAGPLCANLLGLRGARVIKVESARRPDGARGGAPGFFELLHRGHDSVVLDFATHRADLHALLARADVVLESSRPRALRQLDIVAEDHVAGGTIWASITAYGRDVADGMRVGFGDDVAAGAGLVWWDDDRRPNPVGDALADPLAGAFAAAAVAVALRGERGCLLDVSMHDVAAGAATLPTDRPPPEVVRRAGDWYVVSDGGRTAVRCPRVRG